MRSDAFLYPFRGNGWIQLLTGSAFLILAGLLMAVPRAGLLVALFTGGFLGAHFLGVVESTLRGDEVPPDWPSVSDFAGDILEPLCRLLGVGLISFGPLLAIRFLGPPAESWRLPATLVAAVWGAGYFPMAVVAVAAADQLAAASPHIVLPAVTRALPGYGLDVAGLALVWGALYAMGMFTSRVPLLGWVLAGPSTLYGLRLLARWIGLSYCARRHRIGWE